MGVKLRYGGMPYDEDEDETENAEIIRLRQRNNELNSENKRLYQKIGNEIVIPVPFTISDKQKKILDSVDKLDISDIKALCKPVRFVVIDCDADEEEDDDEIIQIMQRKATDYEEPDTDDDDEADTDDCYGNDHAEFVAVLSGCTLLKKK